MCPRSERKRPQRGLCRLVLAGGAAAVIASACGTKASRAPFGSQAVPSAAGNGVSAAGGGAGRFSRGAGRGGEPSETNAGGESGQRGGGTAGDAAEAGATGTSEGGAGTRGGVAGSGEGGAPDAPEPAPVPICSRATRWNTGRTLALSTPDDDLLEGVTPDGLTLVFAAGGRFYLADRDSTRADFVAAVEVAADLGWDSVSVSSDGLRLIGAGPTGFAEIARAARGEPFTNQPDSSSFEPFNAALSGTPTNEIAVEPLLGVEDTLLVYSFVSPSNEAARPTLFASDWLGQWSFGQPLPGVERLWAQGQTRRIATGLSSDGLTLFYRDDVEGEFRSAWRRRLTDAFDAFQSLGDLARAAPDGACQELYYSESAGGGLDLFVAAAL